MQTTTKLLGLAFVASFVAMSMPATATAPDGNYSLSFDLLVVSEWDFKEGTGIYEPGGPANPCEGARLLGLRAIQPVSSYYDTLRIATNLKGPGVSVSGITPIDLVACPLPVVPPQGTMQVWFSGINWRLGIDAMSSELNLCSQLIQSTDGGCIPDPTTVDLRAADCTGSATFGHDNLDGKPDFGVWDLIGGQLGGTIFSDSLTCSAFGHSHDYSSTVTVFDTNYAAQGYDLIQNADIVHNGSGNKYAVVCWSMDYVNLDGIDANGDGDTSDVGDTPAGTTASAATHDWKLILDLGSAPTSYSAPVLNHLSPLGPNFLQGLYSTAPGAGAGNGFGGCPAPSADHDKKGDLIPLI